MQEPRRLGDRWVRCGGLAFPARVLELSNGVATIERDGFIEEISVDLEPEVAIGDVLLRHAGAALPRRRHQLAAGGALVGRRTELSSFLYSDLKVQVPGDGTSKLNAAYSFGGPNLLIKVLQREVFPGLRVNHIVDVNFGGFQALVNAIGCVYVDVDHRYYNNTALTGYSSIDIQPGYQKLCGPDALAFVRFRHTDSDLVRNARQQDLIRWAKDQYGVSNVIANKDKLLRIFGAHTQTDPGLHTIDGLINLFNLAAFSAGHAIKQVKFPAIILPCPVTAAGQTPCYVSADPGAEASAFRAFMRPTRAVAAVKKETGKRRARAPLNPSAAGLIADVADGKSQAAALSHVGIPVYYPRQIVAGSSYCSSLTANCPLEIASPGSYPRAYMIRDQSRHLQRAYRMTLELNPVLGEYFGVQGTSWQHPPILANPAETRTVSGKRLELYANGGKLNDVAWRTQQGAYWISNTLTSDISNQQMIAIAASLTRARP